MPQASARRSFHGPLLPTVQPTPHTQPTPARPLELLPVPARSGGPARSGLLSTRDQPRSVLARERLLAGVLLALQGLTGAKP